MRDLTGIPTICPFYDGEACKLNGCRCVFERATKFPICDEYQKACESVNHNDCPRWNGESCNLTGNKICGYKHHYGNCPDYQSVDICEPETEETPVEDTVDDQTIKADAGKPKLALVPRQIIFDIAKVREYGLAKYGTSESWRDVDIQRYRDATFRHFMAYLDNPTGVDAESGLTHLSHLACNIAFLCELEKLNNTEDETI